MKQNSFEEKEIVSFWNEVALKIESEFGMGHPQNWKQSQIKDFLRLFDAKIPELKPKNYDKYANPGLSAATVRRLFITKDSLGREANRDLFSWFLGYDSFQDYIVSKNKNQKEKQSSKCIGIFILPVILGLIALIYWHNNSEDYNNKDAIIDTIKNAMRVELEIRRRVPDHDDYLDSLKYYFASDGEAYLLIKSKLDKQKAKGWTLRNPYNSSNNKLNYIEVVELEENEAKVYTEENWKIEFFGLASQKIEYIYDESNQQEYTLVKDTNNHWRVTKNAYASNSLREVPSAANCSSEEVKQVTDLSNAALKPQVKKIISSGSLSLALVILKCYCEKNKFNEYYNNFLALEADLNQLLRKLNTNSLGEEKFREGKQKLTIKVLQNLDSLNLKE